jgi:hypothetical protein
LIGATRAVLIIVTQRPFLKPLRPTPQLQHHLSLFWYYPLSKTHPQDLLQFATISYKLDLSLNNQNGGQQQPLQV